MLKMKYRKKRGYDRVLFSFLSHLVLAVLSGICLIPFWLVISGSVSDQQSIQLNGYQLIPRQFSLDAYRMLFKIPEELIRAYGVTILVTAAGTGLGLLVTSMASYVLANKDFRYRFQVSFFFYFTSIFGGGLVPWYIFNTKYLRFHNNIIALILPILVNVTYLLILKSYMMSIPESLYESAYLDGAGDMTVYFRIALPLCKAGLATVGLFIALNYWNDWYNAMLYMSTEEKYPLQYMLYSIQQQTQALARIAAQAGIQVANLPSNSLKLAMAVVATGPIVIVYPFVQRYFIAGITIGSVKG